jgi:hypothetical protein
MRIVRLAARFNFSMALWILIALLGTAGSLDARIIRIEIASQTPLFAGQVFGSVGSYEQISGIAYGELDPSDRRNSVITDIRFAPKNSRGMVEYRATFTLQKPVDMSKSDGVLFYEIVNRGVHGQLFNEGGRPGDGFLYRRGQMILWSGWQANLPISKVRGEQEGIDVPVARMPDGSPVISTVWKRFVGPTSNTLSLGAIPGREPASLDTSKASLITAVTETPEGVKKGVVTVPSSDWAFANCRNTPFPGKPDPDFICLKNGADPNLLYELVYQAKDPLVQGVGMAAMRDVLSFFRYAAKDDAGAANPLHSSIKWVIGSGNSQSGRFAKAFLNLGFNEDENGKIVWDGLNSFIAGQLGSFNIRFGVPGDMAELYDPGAEGPLWWADYEDKVRGRPAWGLLHRCSQTKTCPKITEVYGGPEYWYSRGTVGIVGSSAAQDLPLPENVRRYYIAGTSHGGGNGSFRLSPPPGGPSGLPQRQPNGILSNPNSMLETSRALYVGLVDWIVKGIQPPASAYPKLNDKTLVQANSDAMGWPKIPGVPSPDGVVNPALDYDYGPDYRYNDNSGVITKVPPAIKKTITTLVPKVDKDGNEIAGIHTLQLRIPMGTYIGWNPISGGPLKGREQSLAGGYIPFARTKAERLANGDPRPSIEERYHTLKQFVGEAEKQAEELVKLRYLLQEDSARLIQKLTREMTESRLLPE